MPADGPLKPSVFSLRCITLAWVMLPNGNSHRSVGVGIFCGIFPSIGQTVLGDLKLSLGGAGVAGVAGVGGVGGAALDEGPSTSPMSRPMPPRPANNSADGCDLDVLASSGCVLILSSVPCCNRSETAASPSSCTERMPSARSCGAPAAASARRRAAAARGTDNVTRTEFHGSTLLTLSVCGCGSASSDLSSRSRRRRRAGNRGSCRSPSQVTTTPHHPPPPPSAGPGPSLSAAILSYDVTFRSIPQNYYSLL